MQLAKICWNLISTPSQNDILEQNGKFTASFQDNNDCDCNVIASLTNEAA